MTRINSISVLQSRIAKRKKQISREWKFSKLGKSDIGSEFWKITAIESGQIQKEDRAILRQLVNDERSIVALLKMLQSAVNEADLLQLKLDMKNDE